MQPSGGVYALINQISGLFIKITLQESFHGLAKVERIILFKIHALLKIQVDNSKDFSQLKVDWMKEHVLSRQNSINCHLYKTCSGNQYLRDDNL